MRSTRSTVTFSNAFTLPGCPDDLPAGTYEVVAEEELLHGLSFAAWRRTATFLTVRGGGRGTGRTELLPIAQSDLDAALGRDRQITTTENSDAALSPQEDIT